MKYQKWIVNEHFKGLPSEGNLKLIEDELSTDQLGDGECLCKAVYLSVDPYMKHYSAGLPIGSIMAGEQVCQVIKSKNIDFKEGKHYLSKVGWVSHFISNGDNLEDIPIDLENLPLSYALGVLGMPGAAAYFGFNHLCHPKAGQTVLVNAAAGAVGSTVGQLAKIRGCNVIGFVGSSEKLTWCADSLKFDHVFNYKNVDMSQELERCCPDGVDIFFDNCGGDFFHTVVNKHMKTHGKITLCGSMSTYNEEKPRLYPAINETCIHCELNIFGFISFTYKKHWPEAFNEMKGYILDGKMTVEETVYEGFENMQRAFYGLFSGENIGKAIVKIK